MANGTLNALAVAEVVTVAVVETAAVPLVFWLPVALTPGKLMSAEPLNETPPIVRAVWRVVAVVELPDNAPENVVLYKMLLVLSKYNAESSYSRLYPAVESVEKTMGQLVSPVV